MILSQEDVISKIFSGRLLPMQYCKKAQHGNRNNGLVVHLFNSLVCPRVERCVPKRTLSVCASFPKPLEYKPRNLLCVPICIVVVWCQIFSFPAARSGIRLWESSNTKILRSISKLYVTKETTEKLASKLLDGMQPGGGAGFISNGRQNGKRTDWSEMAYDVLQHWVEFSKDAYGRELLDVMEITIPEAASEFANKLLATEGEKLLLKVVLRENFTQFLRKFN